MSVWSSQMPPSAHELAAYCFAQQDPITRGWQPQSRRLRNLELEMAEDLDLATDLELARLRRDRFAPGHPEMQMLDRWDDVGQGLSLMFSIRYEGGDPRLPFVDASVSSRAFDQSDLDPIRSVARYHFGEFGPRYVRLWHCVAAGEFAECGPGMRFLAAPLSTIAGQHVERRGLRVAAAADLSKYDLAIEAYAVVDEKHPDHPGQARIETRRSLQGLVDRGMLFDIYAEASWVGYIGVAQGSRLGLDGYRVREFILTPQARGHGLGRDVLVHLSRILIDRANSVGDVLIGTIASGNRGAMSAALAAGRVDIGGWVTYSM